MTGPWLIWRTFSAVLGSWAAAIVAADTADPTAGWEGLLRTFGPFAPFAALTLTIMWRLYADLKKKDEQIAALIERVLPLATTMTAALDQATAAARTQAERSLSREEIAMTREALRRAAEAQRRRDQ